MNSKINLHKDLYIEFNILVENMCVCVCVCVCVILGKTYLYSKFI